MGSAPTTGCGRSRPSPTRARLEIAEVIDDVLLFHTGPKHADGMAIPGPFIKRNDAPDLSGEGFRHTGHRRELVADDQLFMLPTTPFPSSGMGSWHSRT
jgi:hypothetical protein